MSAVASASPSEKGSAPGCGGCAASPSGVDPPRPFVLLVSLPDEQNQARPGSKGGSDVGERGGRIGEEHRPEAADRQVEAGGVEAMHLGVSERVSDVFEPFGRRQLTGALEHALGHVDAENAARRRGARAASRVVSPVPHPMSTTWERIVRTSSSTGFRWGPWLGRPYSERRRSRIARTRRFVGRLQLTRREYARE
jgi:hypothetical protein